MQDNLNVSIYEDIARSGMTGPDIPVPHTPSYGQSAEDIIVRAALRAIEFSEHIDLSAQKYLEIGANHPVATSATWLLHKSLGMRGVLVEANPRLLEELKRHRQDDLIVHAAVVASAEETSHLYISSKNELSSTNRDFVEQWPGDPIELEEDIVVPALSINDVISEYMDGQTPIFLSLDIEGEDFFVLQSLDFGRFRPAVIQIEPSDHFRVNNSQEIYDFLTEKSYTLIGRTDFNLIFGDELRRPLLQEASSLLQALHEARELNQKLRERFSELRKGFMSGR